MESIEKLRESLKDCTSEAGIEPNRFDTYWITARACDILIDEIEREIAEKYMELPVVDGRPVHIGDELEWTDGYEPHERFTVGMIGRTYCDESYQDFAETHEHGISFSCCRWPEPDRVKELLEERDRVREEVCMGVWSDPDNLEEALRKVDDEYAAKIREAVSTDE